MLNATDVLENIVPISQFGRGKSSQLFERSQEKPLFVTKNNNPFSVVLSNEEFIRLSRIEENFSEIEEEIELIKLVVERSESCKRDDYLSFENALKTLGIDEKDLELLEDPEFE